MLHQFFATPRLDNDGILKPVTTSKWETSIVQVMKPNRKIRLWGNFKVTENKFLKIDKHALPKIKVILATLAVWYTFYKNRFESGISSFTSR